MCNYHAETTAFQEGYKQALSQLQQLKRSLMHRAKKQMECSERTKEEMGARLVRHGAMCYYNAATELENAIRAMP